MLDIAEHGWCLCSLAESGAALGLDAWLALPVSLQGDEALARGEQRGAGPRRGPTPAAVLPRLS